MDAVIELQTIDVGKVGGGRVRVLSGQLIQLLLLDVLDVLENLL